MVKKAVIGILAISPVQQKSSLGMHAQPPPLAPVYVGLETYLWLHGCNCPAPL